MKEQLKLVITQDELNQMQKYYVSAVYEKLCGNVVIVTWDSVIWNRLGTPKHIFITWLAIQGRLQTTGRLAAYGISTNDHCLICDNASGTHQHLFFGYTYSVACLRLMKRWLGINFATEELLLLIRRIQQSRRSKFQKKVILASINALVYTIWNARNSMYWNQCMPSIETSVKLFKRSIQARVLAVSPQKVSQKYYNWFVSL